MLNTCQPAYIGLGSNLGNPEQQIRQAVIALKQLPDSQFQSLSNLYQSLPVGPQDQPEFLNAVALIQTSLKPEQLLDELQSIEHRQLRERTIRWGPRTIDLDILLYGQLIMKTARLEIPHPEICHRLFVLRPLLDISPELALPDGQRLSKLLQIQKEGHIKHFTSGEAFLKSC